MSWLTLLKYGSPVILLIIAGCVIDGKIDTARTEGYAAGKGAAETVCKDETVPAARKEEQKTCADNALITEKTNAQNDKDADAIRTRLAAAELQLRKNRAAPCVPVANLADVYQQGAGAVRSSGSGGIDARDLLVLGANSAERSRQFINCRAFVLDVWAKHQLKPDGPLTK